MNIYQATLMDHYKNPRNRGTLPMPDFSSEQLNPSCGDQICMAGLLQGDVVTNVVFQGTGCVISQATASLLTIHVVGFSRDMILAMDSAALCNLIGMELGPTRLKCALLPLQALQQGLR
ncbi:MAG: iron-sulfur cluster assembly scaffold protein [Candidatus Babeliales bacterium]